MSLTPLQDIESEAHARFGDREPTEAELGEYLKTQVVNLIEPVSLGVAIASATIGLAGLILAGWNTYRAGKPRCPTCGRLSVGTQADGKEKCKMGHEW